MILALCAGFSTRFWIDADESIQLGLSLFIVIGWLWVSEAIHISVTALLIPVLAVGAVLLLTGSGALKFREFVAKTSF